MAVGRRTPRDLAQALSERGRRHTRASQTQTGVWRRETFTLPRPEARQMARDWFSRYPKAAYMTEIEAWRELEGDRIEFTMRRLPTAD